MTNRNTPSGKLVLLLAALAGLAGSQPQSCRVNTTDEYIAQLRETVVNLDPEPLREAASQGDASAQTSLGLMYFHGEGVEENKVEAAKWFRKAAEQGVAPAQYTLGHMYAYGKRVPEDGWEATKWFRLAAEQGHVTAQLRLGWAYWVGGYGASSASGPSEDTTEAVRWMRMAAEQGDESALWILFVIYFDGNQGIPKDYTEAAKWLPPAYAELAEDQLSLGQAYEEGQERLGKDYVKAYACYMLAAAQGSEEASELKDSLREKMTAEQLQEAQQLVAELEEHIEAARSE